MISKNQFEHSAVKAWLSITKGERIPEQVTVLVKSSHRAAYRLSAAGPGGTDIVAKRVGRESPERLLYEEFLPRLNVRTIQYLGSADELDTQFTWLFLEDAGEQSFSPFSDDQRAMMASWMAIFHVSGMRLGPDARLPDRGPAFWRQDLCCSKSNILQALNNPVLIAKDLELLKTIVSQCEVVETQWDRVERLANALPRTLVHCDLNDQNIRVRRVGAELSLLTFDWGRAGWGSPALDLAQSTTRQSEGYSANPDLACYQSAIQGSPLDLDIGTLREVAAVGSIFCYFGFIRDEAPCLATEWVERPIGELRIFQAEINNALCTLGWI